ncbi:hypothetical protein LJC22_03830 [Desulfosarcina sp. OttesenSCG-928-G10]|nr:hypothetical protein [Desulfosarcina sp. OttesenSCG-928-G10]
MNIILALVIQGAIAYAVFMVFRGGPAASITETLSKGMVRPGPLFLAAIFMGMGILIAMFVLIFPGIMLLCRWAVTIPACAVEGLGPIEGMKRSAELTNGYCGTVFGLALIIGVITWMTTIGGFLLGMSGMNSAIAGRLLSAVLSIPPITFNSVMYAVIYYDLRMIKESVSIDRLANVFD